MKVVILAGGYGRRFGAETLIRPKPLIDVAGKPILHHVMEMFADQGHDDFVIALGYKARQVRAYFREAIRESGLLRRWRISLVDTGADSSKIERLRRIRKHIDDGPFLLANCDAVSDVDLNGMIASHRKQQRLVTVLAVWRESRFGLMILNGGDGGQSPCLVNDFREKPPNNCLSINGGIYVVEPEAFRYFSTTEAEWETGVLPALARDQQLAAFRHTGFWQCMDTSEDRSRLISALAERHRTLPVPTEAAE